MERTGSVTAQASAALRLEGVSKNYAGVRALDGASLAISPGSVHALIGSNGAGKSTLVKVIAGYVDPESGASGEAHGQHIRFPMDPSDYGISVIHQDLGLIDDLSALEHVGMLLNYGKSPLARIDWKRERKILESLLRSVGVDMDINRPVRDLSAAERATVAVVRALRQLQPHSKGMSLLVMDEPTSYLSGVDAARVLNVIRDVAGSGNAVLLITHHMKEVLEVCDEVTVMRAGRVVTTMATKGLTENDLVSAMLGRPLRDFYPQKPDQGNGHALLKARGIRGKVVNNVEFDAHAGEILGVTGLIGMGQEELPYLLVGARARQGQVTGPNGVSLTDIAQAQNHGVVLVPGDRRGLSLHQDYSARENLCLPVVSKLARMSTLSLRRERRHAEALMETFGVVPPYSRQKISQFSGGNQQKIALAKWMQLSPKVLLLDEPTNGVDPAARQEIVRLMDALASSGSSIIIFSSDTELLASICHRVLILQRGAIEGQLQGTSITTEELEAWVNSGGHINTAAEQYHGKPAAS